MSNSNHVVKPCNPFAAIRLTEGYHWIDTNTLSFDSNESLKKAKQIDKECGPYYGRDNRTVMIVRVDVKPVMTAWVKDELQTV